MNNFHENYQLLLLSKEYLREIYNWNIAEKHFEQFTCRPLRSQKSYNEYVNKMMDSIDSIKEKTYILVKRDNNSVPLGKIKLFDYKPRNHSAEFGYYLPNHNRNKGLESIILEQFIDLSFADSDYNLNKLYATTASNNIPSIRLLEKYKFRLEGRLREHIIDMFPRTVISEKPPENPLICFREQKGSKFAPDINTILSSHVECVVLMSHK